MQRTLGITVATILLLSAAGSTAEAALAVGDLVKIYSNSNQLGAQNVNTAVNNDLDWSYGRNGGPDELVIASSTNVALGIKSFCLEQNEFFASGTGIYKVSSISNAAVNGGVSGGNPDPINNATAFLFQHWVDSSLQTYVTGNISTGGAFIYSDDQWAMALQSVIWQQEGEPVLPAIVLSDVGILNRIAAINAAITFVGASNNYLGSDVVVVNIVDSTTGALAQSFLGTGSQGITLPIPEPASMLMWTFGLVAAGFARYRRQR